MNLSSLYQDIKQRFSQAGLETPDLEARWIIEARTGLGWADIIARPAQEVDAAQIANIESDVEKRLAGMPLSRIYGEREFWGLRFILSPDTLDPRPDTEILVERALKGRAPGSILDLGTGTGCILIALLHEWSQAQGLGVDLSEAALRTARQNARLNGVEERAAFMCGSWGDAVGRKFDLVVSNPPYIANPVIQTLAKEVRNHDPILALDGGNDGLDAYKNIFSQLFQLLNPGGLALFEIGFDQEKDVVRLVEESGLLVEGVHRDLAGRARVVEISSGNCSGDK